MLLSILSLSNLNYSLLLIKARYNSSYSQYAAFQRITFSAKKMLTNFDELNWNN